MALSVLAYNLTRVNIIGIKPLIAAIGAYYAALSRNQDPPELAENALRAGDGHKAYCE
jgi:hypothetical protein